MKQVFLIAWREYKQYVLSRGFLLFLVMFPLGLIAVSAALGLVEKNKPTRAFAVYDETGLYSAAIDEEIERRQFRSGIAAWDLYLAMNVAPDVIAEGKIPAPFRPAQTDVARAKKFVEAGGFDAARQAAEAYLKPGAPAFVMPRAAYRRLALPKEVAEAGSLAAAEELLRPFLLQERLVAPGGEAPRPLFAAVLIPADFGAGEESAQAQYWSRNLTDTALEEVVSSALSTALQRQAIEEFGLSQETLDEVAAIAAPVSSFRPDKASEEAELGLKDRIETALPAVLTYMLLVIIFGVGNLLLTNTIEERSNKIVEILLSSVTANQLMMGKLLGIAAVGLTMPAIFLVSAGAVSFVGAADESVSGLAMTALALTRKIAGMVSPTAAMPRSLPIIN